MGRGVGSRSTSHDHHQHPPPPSSSTSCDGDHDQKVVVNKASGGLKRGPWTPEEDQKLLAHIEKHGHGSWRSLPSKAGLERCGKSCRLRWTNYLRPDIKRGKFSPAEEQTIIQLHALLGNRWSAIATHLPKRTDNEIKNYWNTHLKKRLTKMGIDPVTHKPKSATLSLGSIDGQTNKTESNLNHMAQWEGARLEAEARLVRESKLRLLAIQQQQHQLGSSSSSSALPYLSKSTKECTVDQDIDSTTSTLSISENSLPILTVGLKEQVVDDHHKEGLKFSFTSSLHGNDQMLSLLENQWSIQPESPRTGNEVHVPFMNFMDGFTDDLLVDDPDAGKQSSSSDGSGSGSGSGSGESGHNTNQNGDDQCSGTDHNSGGYEEENKNYWNEILNLVNSTSPSDDSPVF